MKPPKYRLQPILDEKAQLRDAAVQFLAHKKAELVTETEKLSKVEHELQTAIDQREQTVADYNNQMFAGKYNVEAIRLRKLHLEDLAAKIQAIRQALELQQKAVAAAQTEVAKAEDALIAASKEVQVMEKHKENWLRNLQQEELKKEARELEEIAQTMYNAARISESQK
jgi:flagellar export protein FliJ